MYVYDWLCMYVCVYAYVFMCLWLIILIYIYTCECVFSDCTSTVLILI